MYSRRGIGSLRCDAWWASGLALALVLAPGLWAFHPSYAQIEAKAAAAHGAKRAELLSRLAWLDYDRARKDYEAGQPAAGAASLAALEDHGNEAMQLLGAEAARGKKKGMKKVEIAFRKITFGLDDLGHEVDYTVQPRIEAARRRFAVRRQELLAWMFAGKKRRPRGVS